MKYFNKSGKKLETLTKHTIQNFKRKTLGGVTTTKLSIDQQSLLVHIAALLCKENSALLKVFQSTCPDDDDEEEEEEEEAKTWTKVR